MSEARQTRLIPRRDEPAKPLSSNQETDATTALQRGLAEYLMSLSYELPGSGVIRFTAATWSWAEYEDGLGNDATSYPRSYVGTTDADGKYDGGLGEVQRALFAPGTADGNLPAVGGYALDSFEELQKELVVEIHACDRVQRMGVCAMLESAFRPYPGRVGFFLELPHYFNARAAYTPDRIAYMDSEEDAARNYRKARVVLASRVPVYVLRPLRPVKVIEQGGYVGPDPIPPPAASPGLTS